MIPAIVAVVALLGAGGAIAFAVTSSSPGTASSSPSLSGKNPDQILQASLAAARKADALQLTQSQSAGGQSSTSTVYVGTNGADISTSGAGVAIDVKLVLVNSKVYLKASGLFWSVLLNSNVNKRLLAHWIVVPPSNADISKLTSGLNLPELVSSLFALRSPISETKSGSAATVTLRGTLPDTAINSGDGAGDVATLVVSTTAPFYPVRISFDDKKSGPATMSFSNWDATQALPSVAGAIPMSMLAPSSPRQKSARDARAIEGRLDR
jgi:hypothetical protein